MACLVYRIICGVANSGKRFGDIVQFMTVYNEAQTQLSSFTILPLEFVHYPIRVTEDSENMLTTY